VLFAVVVLVGSGCALDFDAVGPGAGTAGGGGQSQGAADSGGASAAGAPAGGAAGCSETSGSCVDVPTGFSGPFELREGDGCPGDLVLRGTLDGLPTDAEPATCGCDCELGPLTCGHLALYSNGGCSAAPGGGDFAAGLCTGVTDIMSFKPQQGSAGSVACVSDKADPLPLEPMVFQEPFAVCTIQDALGCDDGSCLPAGSGRYCLRSDRGLPCPPETFTEAVLFRTAADYDDKRDCSCTCGPPTATPTCGAGTVSAFSDAACESLIGTFTMSASCQPASGMTAVIVQPLIQGGACGAPATDSIGDVVEKPDAGTALCCTP
jgi:hypothetical protein